MHPILFRIPLPHTPLKLWWALAAVIVIALAYGIAGARRRDRNTVTAALVAALVASVASWKWHAVSFESENLPIYAYGVMLGLSLIIGWYLSLSLAERDGLPKETMANCYVVTALAALAGSRVLYVVTNLDDFHSFWDFFALRNGGLVAYGGFLGGLLGSWAFLAGKGIRLLAWADDAVPSLASGLLVTRIGCYLFGCDFGKRLPDGAPGWLKTIGTFPHWPAGTLTSGDGSPAFMRHLEIYRGTPLESELLRMNTSFPVHPTQLYESLVGLGLLGLLLWQRKHLRFRGQSFFLFAFAYGVLRFLLELWRDDVERGSYGPTLDQHIYVPLCLVVLAVGFVFGISLAIPDSRVRTAARVAAFAPAVLAYLALKPAAFAPTEPYQLSTSQIIGVLSALAACYFFTRYWEEAQHNSALALSIGDPEAIRALGGSGVPKPEGAEKGADGGQGIKDEVASADAESGNADEDPQPEADVT